MKDRPDFEKYIWNMRDMEFANEAFDEWLENQPIYYGNKLDKQGFDCWHPIREPDDIYEARLLYIKEVEEEDV